MLTASLSQGREEVMLRGAITDAKTGELLPARVYIQSRDGHFFFARSADDEGSAVEYHKQRSAKSVEMHTTLSPHPFIALLPPGQYKLTVERGKEYLPHSESVELKEEPVSITVKLKRWINMERLGWYSGETHVHRSLDELPNLMLAEDLNVALPLTYWVTKAYTVPDRGDKNSRPVMPEIIRVDPMHVIYPMNTEYEIFTVGGTRHTLGAVFALNHRQVLEHGAPPVGLVAQQVHRQGGLLELDKHNWPWSMMLVPVMQVDLYELANNHIWRTEFHFSDFGEEPPPYMEVERHEGGMTEKGWIEFTFENYYALLNCGMRLRPTAGTASGVHPVPLGFGRVYVHLENGFSYDNWIKGLDQGRSFVTTGPMLAVKLNDRWPGYSFRQALQDRPAYHLTGWAKSARPLSKIEIVSAGSVLRTLSPVNQEMASGGYESPIDVSFEISDSTWIGVRCYEPTEAGRVRFAHTAPFFIEVPGKPLRPRHEQIDYLIQRVKSQLARNEGVLSEDALKEFREALSAYQQIAEEVMGVGW
ncbi:CehA/McbA family metallohydrolase [Acidobacteria bacterium AH-259-G07]|nr:CehA/McbA family metallohydrolase [Acidobacteria bacterium AH-259-G07]